MSLVVLAGIRKSYGGYDVLRGVDLTLRPGDRTGMVGGNGCGKTTLLRIIRGLEEPDAGDVAIQKGLTIGFLPQVHDTERPGTLMEVMLGARPDVNSLKDRLDFAAREIERLASDAGGTYERALQDYAELVDGYERAGGYTYENEITGALAGMGFREEDHHREASSLSGGERTRLELARLLVGRHGLLLLDEPTNHLDIGSIEWLEDFISRFDGTILMVSHDRYFLDRIATSVIEIDNGTAETYPGNYSRYLKLRAERREAMAREYELAKTRYDKEKEYIDRMRAGQNARQAKGREKRLARFEMPDRPSADRRPISVGFGPDPVRSAAEVIAAKDVTVRFAGRTVLDGVSLKLMRGDRLAIVGPNGAGKSTLIKTLMGELTPDEGEVRLGGKVRPGYYSQGLESLDPASTVLEAQWSVTPMETEQEIRSRLGLFLFSGDDADKPVTRLSGGEKGRLAISRIVATGANLLVLDEPTNHLDIPSREALEAALANFGGTVIAVSHDRYFIDAFADKVCELSDGRLTLYHGDYSYYESKKRAELDIAQESDKEKSSAGKEEYERRKRERSEQNRSKNRERLRQENIDGIESEIAGIEDRISALEAELSDPASYGKYGNLKGLTDEYEKLKLRREELYGLLEKELA